MRYHQAMSETLPTVMFSVLCSSRSGPTLLAIVISSPSRIHAMPSAITSLVWNLDQGSRSIRAGMRLRRYGLLLVLVDVAAIQGSHLSRPCVSVTTAPLVDDCYPNVSWCTPTNVGSRARFGITRRI